MILAASVLYIISLSVTVYDKYCTMLDRWEKPGLYRIPVAFVLFFTGKLALLVAYFVSFWLSVGLFAAFCAVAFHYVFGSIWLRRFFRKRVACWYPHMVAAIHEVPDGEPPPTDAEVHRQAVALAESAALKAMRNENI
jgi:hypothetical protein